MVSRFITDERVQRDLHLPGPYAGAAAACAGRLRGDRLRDTVAGVYFPRGGMRRSPKAGGAAADAGVQFHNASVTRLEQSGSRVTAVHRQR